MKNGKYRETSKMSDLICENYPMVLVMSRFGIDLGFGEKNIGEVCRQNEIDTHTFLTVVNFLTEEETVPTAEVHKDISISSLITYLHNAHDYFLNFRLPHIRHKLTEAIVSCPKDVAFVKYNITIFRKRHDQIEMKITELKNLILKYYPGPDSNLLNSVLFDIFATEQDLASHNRVEDYIFVPAILSLEKQ